MNNNQSFSSQQTNANTNQTVQNPEKTIQPTKKTMEELLDELSPLFIHSDLWKLTYMVHSNEFFKLKDQQKENVLPLSITELCASHPAISKLEYLSRCVAEQKNGFNYYHLPFTFGTKNLCSKCSYCTDDIAFCPHKMATYIEFICKNNNLNTEDVYRIALMRDYEEKPKFEPFTELQIPEEEYRFIDAVSATAAAELIKMKLVDVSSETENKLLYSYLPICEKSSKSFIIPVINYYKTKSGKHDSLNKYSFKEDICENRNCAGCLFPQCPDKVAAYLSYLAKKYNIGIMKLAEFVITKTKISGVTLRGNFRYYDNIRKLDEIPFTPESRSTINRIIKYVVNRHTVSSTKVPFIPFNLAIYTKDEKSADDTVAIFKDVLNYYAYYDGSNSLKLIEYKFSDKGISGILDIIKDIKTPTIIHIKELALLSAMPETNSRNITIQMTQLINSVANAKNNVCIVVSGEKSKLDAALSQYNDFYLGTLSYHISLSDMSKEKIVQEILQNLKGKYELEEGFESALRYYVLSKYGESSLKSNAFIESVTQNIIFNHYNKEINTENKLSINDIPAISNRRPQEEVWKDLNGLTGLENVKDEIRSIEQLLKFQNKIQNLGIKATNRPNMHMVFAGNPGTGKTTVARLISEILYNVGFIKQNKLIEVSSKDLIGKFIGHTAPKTAAICESAYGGVLFIDEAYELSVKDGISGGTASFRSECIAELIKQMEDNRDRLIVIFAGYSKEMQELLDSNAGFASRIGRIITFEDYSTDQLTDMFYRMIYKNGLRISEEAKETLVATIEKAKLSPNFGNARYIRNLYENVIMEHAKNMVDVDDADILIEIQKNDIPLS